MCDITSCLKEVLFCKNNSINIIDYSSALFFSLLSIVGFTLKHHEAFFEIINVKISLYSIILFIILFTLIYKLIIYMIRLIISCLLKSKILSYISGFVFNNNYKTRVFLVLFVFWLPYIIILYPAHIEWDAYHGQILTFLNNNIDIHQPVFSTLLFGGFVKIGYFLFDSYDIGIFIYTLIQSTIAIIILSLSIFVVYELFLNRIYCTILLIIYSISPIFPGFLTWVVKDAPYALSIFLSIILIIKYIYINDKSWVMLLITLSLVALFRKNGVHLLIMWMLYIVFFYFFYLNYSGKFKLNKIIILFILSIIIGFCYNKFLKIRFPLERSTDLREAMSVPFQQTARYVNKYSDELTVEEIDSINSVLNINIGRQYNPTLSDPVKGTFHAGYKELLKIYMPIWWKMFKKHPETYFDATLMNSYGFWYPGQTIRNLGIQTHTWSDNEQLVFYEPKFLKPIKRYLNAFLYIFTYIPPFSFFFNCGVSVFVMIYLIIYSIVLKKSINFIFLTPIIISFIICIVSPTWSNNGIRYALPILISIPFLFFVITGSNIKLLGR